MGDEDGIMTAKTSKVQLDSLICRSPSDVGQKGHEAGWRVTKGKRWVVCWGSIFTAAEFAGLHEFQRVNHFPGTAQKAAFMLLLKEGWKERQHMHRGSDWAE
eukprot:1153841-Pelagomonas_calceolata.AAC.3